MINRGVLFEVSEIRGGSFSFLAGGKITDRG